MSDRHLALALKLLETLHLSVAERAELPNGRAAFSLLVDAAQRALGRTGWLPVHQRPTDTFTGVLIEARGDAYWIHERHETGVARLGPTTSRHVQNLAEAVRARIADVSADNIDGVPVDWHR